jgi:eukaryotic-like serine/threonine-protein kinase
MAYGGSVPGPTPPSQVRFPQPGEILASARGEYSIVRAVGKGAYGTVYEVEGPFAQTYALKLLVPASRPYEAVAAEWRHEVSRMLTLRHPGVVYVHDAFEKDFLFYMALEWCTYSLRDLLTHQMLPSLAIELTRQMLAAVQYLHDHDVVHGDLHAGNVLVVQADRPVVKLADFGIAHDVDARGHGRPSIVHHAILPPEVIFAEHTSRQSDLYQIGLLLYQMVTGRTALDYGVPYEALKKQITDGLPRQRAEALGTPLGNVIARMLRRREEHRYPSARDVWRDLAPLR